ncbi:hypothetical protein GCM10029992_29060 [Glycomyces albus]
MTPVIVTLVVLLLVGLILMVWMLSGRNKLVRLRNITQESWAQIDVELQRRYDLLDNLMYVVQQAAGSENATLQQVAAARSNAMHARQDPNVGHGQQGQAEGQLSGAIRGVIHMQEQYPTLKTNQNFLQLQTEIVETENRIAAPRRFYNANVREYNTALQVFPTSISAKSGGFQPEEYFELDTPRPAPRPDCATWGSSKAASRSSSPSRCSTRSSNCRRRPRRPARSPASSPATASPSPGTGSRNPATASSRRSNPATASPVSRSSPSSPSSPATASSPVQPLNRPCADAPPTRIPVHE